MIQLIFYLIIFLIALWLILYVFLPSLLLFIVLTIGGVGSYASLTGFWNGGKSFIFIAKKAWQNAEDNPLSNPIAKKINNFYGAEAAFLLPIYDKYWSFMIYLSSRIWPEVHKTAKGWFNRAKTWWTDASYKGWFNKIRLWSAAIGAYIGGVFHYVATFLFVAIAILGLLAVIIAGILLSSIIMVFFGLVNKLYGWYYQISYVCPTCHEKMEIPVHICDNCGTEHKKLRPSVYGIRHHHCSGVKSRGIICNQKLATLGKLRTQLSKRCPHCNSPVEGLGGTNIHIPIIGGRAVGKSHFITMSLMKLMDYAPSQKLEITFPDYQHQNVYTRNKSLLEQGQRLQSTTVEADGAKAFNLQVKKVNQKIPKLLYIYDAAGEYFTSEYGAEQQRYFKYIHGVFFIVDPFAIEPVRDTYRQQLRENPGIIQPSTDDLDTAFTTMITAFEQRLKVKSNQKLHQPIAIIVNKCDAFDLSQKIGQQAAMEYMQRYPEATTESEAIHRVVKTFLENYASNFVQNLEARFANVRYFSCSSIMGHGNNNTDSTRVGGERVLEPMLWLMSQAKVVSGEPPLLTKVFSRR